MTIDELIERLQEYRETLGGDAEVRLAEQPSWPFEYSIAGLTSGAELNDSSEDDDSDSDSDAVVFIVEGTQLGYGTKRIWDAI